jgi:hypothetical protein
MGIDLSVGSAFGRRKEKKYNALEAIQGIALGR